MPSLSVYRLTLNFSYLGCGVSLHCCSSKVQPLLLTLDVGYLLCCTAEVSYSRSFSGDALTLTCIWALNAKSSISSSWEDEHFLLFSLWFPLLVNLLFNSLTHGSSWYQYQSTACKEMGHTAGSEQWTNEWNFICQPSLLSIDCITTWAIPPIIHGKFIFHNISPCCWKGWGLLL